MSRGSVDRLSRLSVAITMLACAGACGRSGGSAGTDSFDSDGWFSLQLPCDLLLTGGDGSACITSASSGVVLVPSSDDWKSFLPYAGSVPPTPDDAAALSGQGYEVDAIGQSGVLLFGRGMIRRSGADPVTFHWAYDTARCAYFSDLDREIVVKECGIAAIPWESMHAPEHFARQRIR